MKLLLLMVAALMTVGGGLWWYGSPDAPFGPLLAGLGVALFRLGRARVTVGPCAGDGWAVRG